VATLKAIARGELRKDYPEVCDAYPDVVRTQTLFVGLLLHDVGKPLGSNHAEKGAVMAERRPSSSYTISMARPPRT